MSQRRLMDLRARYPGRSALKAEEVARELGKRDTRGVVQEVRRRLKSGHYRGGRKIDGLWQIPLEDLATLLDPPPTSPVSVSERPGTVVHRRRAQIGPRMSFVRAASFWADVLDARGHSAEAEELRVAAAVERRALQDEAAETKARRSRESLEGELAAVLATKDPAPPRRIF